MKMNINCVLYKQTPCLSIMYIISIKVTMDMIFTIEVAIRSAVERTVPVHQSIP